MEIIKYLSPIGHSRSFFVAAYVSFFRSTVFISWGSKIPIFGICNKNTRISAISNYRRKWRFVPGDALHINLGPIILKIMWCVTLWSKICIFLASGRIGNLLDMGKFEVDIQKLPWSMMTIKTHRIQSHNPQPSIEDRGRYEKFLAFETK